MASYEDDDHGRKGADSDDMNDGGNRRRFRSWQEWMMLAMGMTTLVSILAIILSVSAVATKSPSPSPASGSGAAASTSNSMSANMSSAMTSTSSSTTAETSSTPTTSGTVEAVKLLVKSDEEHGKKGPDGKWHDAFLPANFTVHAGDTIQVTVYNYDDGAHSFTSNSLSTTEVVDEQIPGGSESKPSKTTFTFTAPTKTGKYLWWCSQPCDPWAMKHIGYMRGYVTVIA